MYGIGHTTVQFYYLFILCGGNASVTVFEWVGNPVLHSSFASLLSFNRNASDLLIVTVDVDE